MPERLAMAGSCSRRQNALSAAEQQRLAELDARVKGTFQCTVEDLAEIVSFDRRDDRGQLEILAAKGGVQGIGKMLLSDVADGGGLDPNDDLELRRHAFGENRVPQLPPRKFLDLVWDALEDTTLRILLVGAAVTLTFGMIFEGVQTGWQDGVAIFIAVLLVVSVTSGNDYLKERKFQKIFLLASDKLVKVVRGGTQQQVSVFAVCVGDIVELATGDEVPADGIFVTGANLEIDESALTGESLTVKKREDRPFLFSGCEVTEGSGRMLVTAIGVNSSGGQIQQLLNSQGSEDTALQEKLADMAVQIGKFGIIAAIMTFAALMIRWGIQRGNSPWSWSELVSIVQFFVIAVTIVVVAVPEGLPLAVTISLAFSMSKMIKDRNFVRHLDASETMGEATCICTDKTGTLTENRMTVVQAYLGAGEDKDCFFHVPPGSASEGTKPHLLARIPSEDIRSLLTENICLNSQCFVEDMDSPTPVFVGSKTEGALLMFAYKMGVSYRSLRGAKQLIRCSQFSSERKRSSALVAGPSTARPTVWHSYVKGAAEIVLSLCTSVAQPNGLVTALDEAMTTRINAKIVEFASQGLRTISLAYRRYTTLPREDADIESGLTFLGIVGIKDPVRQEVPAAVLACRQAGIVVRMVTGDNVLTAKHIARECGILASDGVCMEGPLFRVLSMEEQNKIIPKLQVLARSSPHDKFVLVSRLQELGNVVAVTGDGTNDAPALKKADVGFSMGIAGTDIAKTASDIVLLDDNFSSIVSAIKWGRNVFESIRKFVQFQLTVNVVAVLMTFISSVATGASAFSAVQLLWVNLIMDTFGALALATDPPRPGVLRTRPVRKDEGILTRSMVLYVAVNASYQLFVLLFLMFYGYRMFGVTGQTEIYTLVFTTFVLMQISNELNARLLYTDWNIFRGLLENPFFLPIMVLIIGVQVVMVQWGSSFTQTVPLTLNEWIGCAVIAISELVLGPVSHLPQPPLVEIDFELPESSSVSSPMYSMAAASAGGASAGGGKKVSKEMQTQLIGQRGHPSQETARPPR